MSQVDELRTERNGEGLKAEPFRAMFTPEQQIKVQELIDESYRRAYAKASKGLGGPGGVELEGLKKEVESLREEKKMAAILRVVARHNVVDPEEVAELLIRHVAVDGGGNIGVTREGGRENGGAYAPTLDEYVGEWLRERPHHLRPTGSSGGGSSSARFGERTKTRYNLSEPDTWRSMPREDLDKLLKEGVNVHGSGGHVFKFKDVQNPFVEARKRKFKAG